MFCVVSLVIVSGCLVDPSQPLYCLVLYRLMKISVEAFFLVYFYLLGFVCLVLVLLHSLPTFSG